MFERFILAMIVLAAVLVGIETYPAAVERYGDTLHFLNEAVLWVFVVEALMKMGQHGAKWYRYFLDPWNLFDFSIVAVCFLPVNSSYAAVLRLARIARALRLMTALPKLQLIVGAMLKCIPSMGYVSILLGLLFYVYAVVGVFLFGDNDPVHFKDLQTAMLSLFRVVTLEDWTDVMYIQMYGSNVYSYANTTGIEPIPSAMPVAGAAFFVTFVLFGTMIMLNLFIGVIINSMDEAQKEHSRSVLTGAGAENDLVELESQLELMQERIARLRTNLKKSG